MIQTSNSNDGTPRRDIFVDAAPPPRARDHHASGVVNLLATRFAWPRNGATWRPIRLGSYSCARQGLTLIELLVAIAITVLLIGVVYMVYGTALNTIRTQTAWRETLEPAADALDVLQRDLLCSLALKGVTNPPFVLTPAGEDGSASTLRFFTAWPGEGSNDWRTYGIREVEYALRAKGATGRYALVRQCRPFRIAPSAAKGPLAPQRGDVASAAFNPAVGAPLSPGRSAPAKPGAAGETLLHSLAGMQIQVYDGKVWTNAWGAGAAPGTLPQAARISLLLELPSGPRTINSETLIPAGHKIKAPASAVGNISGS